MIPKVPARNDLKEVVRRSWEYVLYQHQNGFVLSVLCGKVGLYEVNIELAEEEIASYGKEGIRFINVLSSKIAYAPASYQGRHITILAD